MAVNGGADGQVICWKKIGGICWKRVEGVESDAVRLVVFARIQTLTVEPFILFV